MLSIKRVFSAEITRFSASNVVFAKKNSFKRRETLVFSVR